jgi:hypothetical protein
MHDDVTADAKWVLMWHVLIGYSCIIFACVENYIKWLLVGHLYILTEDPNPPAQSFYQNH